MSSYIKPLYLMVMDVYIVMSHINLHEDKAGSSLLKERITSRGLSLCVFVVDG